jgi:hypothetical protein
MWPSDRAPPVPGLLKALQYTGPVDDLFSVPLGYVDPDQGPDDGLSTSSIPSEAFKHPGKWVALRGSVLDTVSDTQEELLQELGGRRSEVSLFHVPSTRIFAR